FPHTCTTDAYLSGCVLFVSGCILRLSGSGSYGSTGEPLVPMVWGGGVAFFPISLRETGEGAWAAWERASAPHCDSSLPFARDSSDGDLAESFVPPLGVEVCVIAPASDLPRSWGLSATVRLTQFSNVRYGAD